MCGPTARETHQRPWKISFVTPKGLFQQYRHETDLTRCRLFGRYRGISGSNTDIVKLSRMTHSGHHAPLDASFPLDDDYTLVVS
jgi:hypothetical protein